MQTGICLYWIPLGAGGSGFVRMNGRIYETIDAARQGRRSMQLLHTALQIRVAGARHVVETMWPRPDLDGGSRGVVADGAVFADWLSFTRVFRYEVRCWVNGVLPDAEQAIGGPQMVGDEVAADRLLELTGLVPRLIWGRRPPGSGDMWNSNSVVSWLLAMSGLPVERLRPPDGTRAPGWEAGIAVARRADDLLIRNRRSCPVCGSGGPCCSGP